MSEPEIDLPRLVGRREQLAYEHHLARRTYAYGVDLRRAAWLDQSTLGEPMMRGVDRRWASLVEQLSVSDLQPPNAVAATNVLERLARLVRLLHAPLPTVRLLHDGAKDWPVVTPLGTTKGGAHWLIIDAKRLAALPEDQQTFLLASALGRLQCGHGPLFAVHLMARRNGGGMKLLTTILRAWSRVTVFSADRAALIALGELEPTLEALRAHADPGVTWQPPSPDAAERVRGLQDFDQSRVMAGLRLNPDRSQWSLAPVAPTLGAAAGPPQPPPSDNDASERTEDEDAVSSAERTAETIAEERAEAEQRMKDAEELLERAREIEASISKAWSIRRCDARLTRRLGLL